jgi:hypothetical protein
VAIGQPNDCDSITSVFCVASTSPTKLVRAAGPRGQQEREKVEAEPGPRRRATRVERGREQCHHHDEQHGIDQPEPYAVV